MFLKSEGFRRTALSLLAVTALTGGAVASTSGAATGAATPTAATTQISPAAALPTCHVDVDWTKVTGGKWRIHPTVRCSGTGDMVVATTYSAGNLASQKRWADGITKKATSLPSTYRKDKAGNQQWCLLMDMNVTYAPGNYSKQTWSKHCIFG